MRYADAMQLDHIAFQVRSLEKSLERLLACFPSLAASVGEAAEFADEGTREIYVGSEQQDARVLLIEPIGPGPYESSMQRRGPGLHHVAVGVPSVETYVDRLARQHSPRWLLHPKSLASLKAYATVWLTRPGIPALVEVFEQPDMVSAREELAVGIGLPCTARESALLDALDCPALHRSASRLLKKSREAQSCGFSVPLAP
jgi:hypothetical protein